MAERRRSARTLGLAAGIGLTVAATAMAATTAGATAGDGDVATGVDLAGAWSREERAAVATAVTRIPVALRPRGRLAIGRDARDCDTTGWPVDDDDLLDDRGRIHLCAPAGAVPAMQGADPIGRRVALALLFAFDRAARWSDDPAWRRLNRWRASIGDGLRTRAANLDPAGYAETRGQRSPRWDLVTFLGALVLDARHDDTDDTEGIGCRLLSQKDFVNARAGQIIGPGRCAAFEAWADLPHLAGVEVVLAAPSTSMIGSLFGHLFLRLVYRDPEYDGDGDGDAVGDDDEVTPAHLSRTVAFLADNDVPFTEDPAYAVKGIVGSYTASLHERGFLEAYRDYVVIEGRDLRRWRLALGPAERRALLERIWTVAHGARYAYYFFRRNCATLMVDLIDDTRPPADAVTLPGLLAAPPAATLEPWASMRNAQGAPLLQFVPRPIASFDHLARVAARERIQLEPRLEDALPDDAAAAARAAFRSTHAATSEARAGGYDRLARLLSDRRAGDARDLAAWLRDSATLESQLSTLANLQAEARADRERRRRVDEAAEQVTTQLRADVATLLRDPDAARARAAETAATAAAARLAAALEQVTAFEPARRLEGYRSLLALTNDGAIGAGVAGRLRLLALLQSERRYDVARMKSAAGLRDALLFVDPSLPIERQPYLQGRWALLHLDGETRVSPSLRSVQRAKEILYAARDLGGASRDVVDGERDSDSDNDSDEAARVAADVATATATAARRDYDASLPHSGIDRLALLAGVATGGAPARAGLVLAGALYDEQLGDHRRFGFPSDTALVVARSDLFVVLANGAPAVASYDARVFGYRSMGAALPEAGGARWPLGWELYGTLEGDRARALATAAKVGWGVLAPLRDRGELTDHLLAALGLAYAAHFPAAPAAVHDRPQSLSAPIALELRRGLGVAPRYRSWIAARVWIEPMAVVGDARVGLASDLGARLETRVALPGGAPGGARDAERGRALLVRAQMRRTTLTFTGATASTDALVSVGFDLR